MRVSNLEGEVRFGIMRRTVVKPLLAHFFIYFFTLLPHKGNLHLHLVTMPLRTSRIISFKNKSFCLTVLLSFLLYFIKTLNTVFWAIPCCIAKDALFSKYMALEWFVLTRLCWFCTLLEHTYVFELVLILFNCTWEISKVKQ